MPRDADPAFDLIPAADYPAVMRSSDAKQFLDALKSEAMHKRVHNVIAGRRFQLCDAVRAAATRLEAAFKAGDMADTFAQAHEIRGIAETCGLDASGRIAEVLCRYLDAMAQDGGEVDLALVGLHVGAIVRAAHAEDEATRLGTQVADELNGLVTRRIGPAANMPPG